MASAIESRLKLPAELKPESVVAVIDTREQIPLDLSPLQIMYGTLATGDYSLAGYEDDVAIERKSLPDLLGCVGVDRERFDREIQRMRGYSTRALIVEATWRQIRAGGWRSRVTPAAVEGSLRGWEAKGIPVVLTGNHKEAGRHVARMLFLTARRKWRGVRKMIGLGLKIEGDAA